MKIDLRAILLIVFTIIPLVGFTQIYQPVKWTFSVNKISYDVFTLSFTANIQPGWHVYSHIQPKKAVATPLSIKFNSGSGIRLEGKALEIGNLEKYNDESTGIMAYQYSNKLTVRQIIQIKNVKGTVAGTLTYQTCNDERCLPPEDIEFDIKLH